MAVTHKGVGTVFGVSGTADSAVPGIAYLTAQSANADENVESVTLRNQEGKVSGAVVYDSNETIEITWVPSAATLANAATAMVLPAPGAVVVLSAFVPTEVNGNWIYMGPGRRQYTNDGIAQFVLTLTRYATDISATISS